MATLPSVLPTPTLVPEELKQNMYNVLSIQGIYISVGNRSLSVIHMKLYVCTPLQNQTRFVFALKHSMHLSIKYTRDPLML